MNGLSGEEEEYNRGWSECADAYERKIRLLVIEATDKTARIAEIAAECDRLRTALIRAGQFLDEWQGDAASLSGIIADISSALSSPTPEGGKP